MKTFLNYILGLNYNHSMTFIDPFIRSPQWGKALPAITLATAIAGFLFMPMFKDHITLTTNFTSTWAPGLYVNASGHISLFGYRSIWDKLAAPISVQRVRDALRPALLESLDKAGPRLIEASFTQEIWKRDSLVQCSQALETALGGQWSATSRNLVAIHTSEAPLVEVNP